MLYILHVYMISCTNNTAFQSSFPHKVKSKTDVLKFYTEILRYNRSTPEAFLHNGKIHQRWRVCVHDSFSQQPELRDIVARFIISLLLDPVSPLTAYQLSHLPVILFWSGSLQSFLSLPFNRVHLLHYVLIFNRAGSPLLNWKLFTSTFCTSSLTLTDKLNERFFFPGEQHVLSTNQQKE